MLVEKQDTRMDVEAYGETLFDLDTTVTGMLCLGLLHFSDVKAVGVVEDMTRDLDSGEMAKAFGIDQETADDMITTDMVGESLLQDLDGWVVTASVGAPGRCSFSESGNVKSYQIGAVSYPVTVYEDTLASAMNKLVETARDLRHKCFNKARVALGKSEMPAEADD